MLLERGVVGNSLSPADVTRLLGLGVDVLCVDFAALVRDPVAVLDRIAGLCGRPPGGLCPPVTAVNPSVAARSRVRRCVRRGRGTVNEPRPRYFTTGT